MPNGATFVDEMLTHTTCNPHKVTEQQQHTRIIKVQPNYNPPLSQQAQWHCLCMRGSASHTRTHRSAAVSCATSQHTPVQVSHGNTHSCMLHASWLMAQDNSLPHTVQRRRSHSPTNSISTQSTTHMQPLLTHAGWTGSLQFICYGLLPSCHGSCTQASRRCRLLVSPSEWDASPLCFWPACKPLTSLASGCCCGGCSCCW